MSMNLYEYLRVMNWKNVSMEDVVAYYKLLFLNRMKKNHENSIRIKDLQIYVWILFLPKINIYHPSNCNSCISPAQIL
jgi:hypothetical protein